MWVAEINSQSQYTIRRFKIGCVSMIVLTIKVYISVFLYFVCGLMWCRLLCLQSSCLPFSPLIYCIHILSAAHWKTKWDYSFVFFCFCLHKLTETSFWPEEIAAFVSTQSRNYLQGKGRMQNTGRRTVNAVLCSVRIAQFLCGKAETCRTKSHLIHSSMKGLSLCTFISPRQMPLWGSVKACVHCVWLSEGHLSDFLSSLLCVWMWNIDEDSRGAPLWSSSACRRRYLQLAVMEAGEERRN